MRNRVLIVCVVLLVLVIICVVMFAFTKNENGLNMNTEQLEHKIISISNTDELNIFAREHDLDVYYSNDKSIASIINFDFWNSPAEMTVEFDESNEIGCFNVYIALCNVSEFDSNRLEDQVYDMCRMAVIDFSKLFNVRYDQNIQLTKYDGTFLELKSATDIISLISEESYVNFAVRDKNGCYYIMQISLFESVLEVNIKKYFDVEKYKDYVANISLYEEE